MTLGFFCRQTEKENIMQKITPHLCHANKAKEAAALDGKPA
jgi:hypothetical protein